MEDQKKCPQCAEFVQAEANVCRYCGHQFVAAKKKLGAGKGCLIIFAAIIALSVLGKFVGPTSSTAPAGGAGADPGSASVSALPKSTWQYGDSKDQMGSDSRSATLVSENTVDFGFPYNGEQHGTLIVRKTKGRTDVMFTLDKGQILCHSFSNDTISVKFDSGPIEKLRCVGPADSSTETAFFTDGNRMLRGLLSAKTVVIEPNIYHEGGTQFTFETAGLKWDR